MILTVLSLLFIRPMLQLMQTPPEILDQAQTFISIILLGIFASVSFNLLSNVIRALGDSRTPLFFLIIAVIINVVLDLIFIIYFGMGVEGAAIATVIAQVSSSVLCLVYIKKNAFVTVTQKISNLKRRVCCTPKCCFANGVSIFDHRCWCYRVTSSTK